MLECRPIGDILKSEQALNLLHAFELQPPLEPDVTLGIYDGLRLIGCCSRKGNVLQGLVTDPSYHGQGVSVTLVTKMIEDAARRGIVHLFVFTKPAMAELIGSLGFRLIVDASPYASFLEYGPGGVRDYCRELERTGKDKPRGSACIVMNCNPFTKGHRYLAEKASAENSFVYIFVVEEDASAFPFSVRLELVRRGVADLSNVLVVPGGSYIVSAVTFPSYFTRQENLAAAQSAIDAEVFGTIIAPALSIKRRYVGSEPYSAVTNVYNQTLKKRLPRHGVSVEEIERTQQAGKAVSASAVREAILNDDWNSVEALVPETTLEYLKSDAAAPVLEKIKTKVVR